MWGPVDKHQPNAGDWLIALANDKAKICAVMKMRPQPAAKMPSHDLQNFLATASITKHFLPVPTYKLNVVFR